MTPPKDGYDKPITTTTPVVNGIMYDTMKPDKQLFESAIDGNAFDCLVEKSVKCPCRNKATGNALPTCQNCGSTGWLFINKKQTRLMVQSMNRQTKFLNWTEDDKGLFQITAKAIDRLAFMDRITILDVESIFSDIVRVIFDKSTNKYFAYLFYAPLQVDYVFLFDRDNKPLKQLNIVDDFYIVENKIYFTANLSRYAQGDEKSITCSARYSHFPQLNVADITREMRANRKIDCAESEDIVNMPMSCVAKRTHYVLDAPNYAGSSVFDNTIYDEAGSPTDNPFNLEYFMRRSTAQQMFTVLQRINNTSLINQLKTFLNGL